jgi:tmRNA-binding protein
MATMVAQQGLTVVPLKAYFNSRSCLKIQVAIARGEAPLPPSPGAVP